MPNPNDPFLSETARAKINLTLHVTGRRSDGYHLLDSLVVFADYGDRLMMRHGGPSLSVKGRFGRALQSVPDNLCLRAAHMTGADLEIVLDKRLPVASGIGGGSADAAAVLRGALRLGIDHQADPIVLGADVPVCLHAPIPARMRGVGEVLEAVPHVPAVPMLLVNPGVAVSTPDVFGALIRYENAPMPDFPDEWDSKGLIGFCADCRNDLQDAAISLVPEIALAIAALDHAGADLARMSGSGATCFGLFNCFAVMTRAAGVIASAHPDWWVCSTRIALAAPEATR